MLERAYALLEVKALESEHRRFTGIASTPTIDRQGHSLDPLGARYTNPLPLLLHHDQARPIGHAVLSSQADGILFEAELPTIEDPGPLRDRVDEAWQAVKAGLYRGVSIGFRVLRDGTARTKEALRLTKTEICELSLVAVPANRDATILSIKALDAPFIQPKEGRRTMTTAEQITELEDRRANLVGRMTAILDDDQMDQTKQKEYDGLEAECQTIDAKLPRLRTFEKTLLASAEPVESAMLPPRAPAIVRPRARVNLEPGTAFVRLAMAKAASAGDSLAAIQYAARWRDTTPEVELLLKAATGPASTASAAWAGALVPTVQHMGSEFIDLLRPATVIGRIPGLRRVPFNVQVPKLTGGGTYRWVGEGAPKPVTQLVFATVALAQYKIAGILTFTLELARSSEPSAEATFRDAMIAGIAQFMDAQFLDPAVALVVGVNPASITNGVTGIVATADPLADITALLNSFVAVNIPISGVVLIMSESNAFILSSQRTATGEPVFPGVTVTGGSINGVPIIASSAAGTNIIAVVPRYVLYADDGGVSIDVSREATVQMDDAPGVPDATTVFRSLWQDNLIGLRAERFVAWIKAHANAVNMITGTAYTPTTVGAATARPAAQKAS
jgi:HK97 family phage major capsid protein/HK97 family phage prohead protease